MVILGMCDLCTATPADASGGSLSLRALRAICHSAAAIPKDETLRGSPRVSDLAHV